MCGLVSVLTKNNFGFSAKDLKIFKQMLFVDTLRGEDSTGVFGVNKHGSVLAVKGALAAPDFISSKSYDEWDTEMFRSGKIMVGHNRSATKGAVDDNNAHPFSVGHITLVHNGTLFGHQSFSDKEVDSHAICELIAEKGYKEALKTIDGAFALIWYDQELDKLFVSRNSKRPLAMVKSKDGNSIYIASELAMIPWILSRNGTEHNGTFSVFEEDKQDTGFVYSASLDSLDFKKESVEFYKPKSYSGGAYGDRHGFYGLHGEFNTEEEEYYKYQQKQKKEEKDEVVDTKKKEEKGGSVLPFSRGSVVGLDKQLPQIIAENEPEKNIQNPEWWNAQRSRVVFKMQDYTPSCAMPGFYHVIGDFRGLEVVCKIKEDLLENYLCYDNLVGEVIRIYSKNGKLDYLSLGNVEPWLESYSKNNVLITPAVWEVSKSYLFCDECGLEITMEDIPKTIIRFETNSHVVRRVVCEGCAKKLSKTGKVNSKQQQQYKRVCH